ncbi:aerobic-type carbon monoxide dehydrogenase, middle subunit CoxM/CutM-like protein [Desulfosporosinus orientis DSM 765]|uniref:Aerobic-type carbon monoxide dehydrogenase, middle subunit CoxM/CutM-like protein n=1 Tax=Desulfosporosinus orientis (strain ATCC 19365 / DSM 765 / NCIMB 8382 / VKM B-1628 / Singapore I) TaxID=768706 RepID=G7WAF0_DESOD|nr:FAD binding domain-containing protein [Desulfosporosinus orientis]AET66499.1 aerobic-type carbon monoxide dehydrogenase, middle subunit CoxM/CutM-like protein [Desulfosporosinus orientis DSM 765]
MFTMLNLVQPDTLEEAYHILTEKRNNTILGGCAFLKMGKKRINTGIDLSRLKLNDIREQNGYIEIGAMSSLRDVETHSLLKEHFNGVLPQSVRDIIGVQFRNGVTVGASVYSRYGFSDLLTALLTLGTEVELYKAGRMPLMDFLAKPIEKDFMVKLWLKKAKYQASFLSFRNSASDYSVINVAVSRLDNQWKIAVGSRPSKAALAFNAARRLSQDVPTIDVIEEAALITSEELSFGTNSRGTAAYRKALCRVLVKRGIMEVLECKSN